MCSNRVQSSTDLVVSVTITLENTQNVIEFLITPLYTRSKIITPTKVDISRTRLLTNKLIHNSDHNLRYLSNGYCVYYGLVLTECDIVRDQT